MNIKEAKEKIEVAKAEVEWYYPIDYQPAFDEAMKAMDKQEAMFPKFKLPIDTQVGGLVCPRCGNHVYDFNDSYCRFCGQHIDWERDYDFKEAKELFQGITEQILNSENIGDDYIKAHYNYLFSKIKTALDIVIKKEERKEKGGKE